MAAAFIPYAAEEYAGCLDVETDGVKIKVLFKRADPGQTATFLDEAAISLLPPEIQARWKE